MVHRRQKRAHHKMCGYGLVLVIFTASSMGCVDPPTVQSVCEDAEAEALCQIEGMASTRACCNVLAPILRTQLDGLSDTQQGFLQGCARQFEREDSEKTCLGFVQRLSPEDVWSTPQMLARCGALYNNVADPARRERDFMLPCVDALSNTAFVADYARDPVALTYFCEQDEGARTEAYSKMCLDTLAAFDWFPGAAVASSEPVRGATWQSVANVPQLCRDMGGPPLCKERNLGTGTLICASALGALSFNAGDVFSYVEQLGTEQLLGRSCRVSDAKELSMYADYGVGGPCLQSENTVGVMECSR